MLNPYGIPTVKYPKFPQRHIQDGGQKRGHHAEPLTAASPPMPSTSALPPLGAYLRGAVVGGAVASMYWERRVSALEKRLNARKHVVPSGAAGSVRASVAQGRREKPGSEDLAH
jgi:hypothetical protein